VVSADPIYRLFIFLILFVVPASLLAGSTIELRHARTLDNDFAITVLTWHPDGRHLAVGQVLNKRVAIWDTQAGKLVRILEKESGGVRTLAYSSDGKYLAVGREFTRLTKDHANVHIYDGQSNDLLRGFAPPVDPIKGDSNDAGALAFSPNNKHLIASGYGSGGNCSSL
jgi:WD40 repeat protein